MSRIKTLLTTAVVVGSLAATVAVMAPPAGAAGTALAQPYASGSYLTSRVDGSSAVVDSARTSQFQTFMKTHPDQKAVTWPQVNMNDSWAMTYAYGKSTDPVWKLTGSAVTGNSRLKILNTQGFHMPDTTADTFPSGTQDRPGLMIDKTFGYTALFADAVPNKATRTIAVSSAGITWHGSNGLDYRNPASNDTRNFMSRGRLAEAMVVTREELDAAVAAGTGVGKVLHLFFVETNSADGFRSPMVGAEGGQAGWGAEGERLRIKPSVDLVARGLSGYPLALARTLQQNGTYLGDNSGSTTKLKMSQTFHYTGTGLTKDVFQGKISWSDFEVLK